MYYDQIMTKEEREKLFDEVWKESVIKVATKYGLSDNGLRKRCIKYKIPLPPQGHWAKLQAGKKVVTKPELPYLNLFSATANPLEDFIDL